MELEITWEEKSLNPAEQEKIKQLVVRGVSEAVCGEGTFEEAEISLLMVDDETIRQLNMEYRGIDRATDVLSFSLLEKGEGEPEIIFCSEQNGQDELEKYYESTLGDIVISIERAKCQAIEFGHSLEREIVYLAVHGALHLLGYDHCNDQDKALMRNKEEEIMKKIGIPR